MQEKRGRIKKNPREKYNLAPSRIMMVYRSRTQLISVPIYFKESDWFYKKSNHRPGLGNLFGEDKDEKSVTEF